MVDQDKTRAAFETHFCKPTFEWEPHKPGGYQNYDLYCAWAGWQAAIEHMNKGRKPVNGPDDLLHLAGKVANAARRITGGPHITCGMAPAGDVYNLAHLVEALRHAVDAYDEAAVGYTLSDTISQDTL